MRWLGITLAYLGAVACILASSAFNVLGSLGKSELWYEQSGLVAASVGADLLKCTAPLAIAAAFARFDLIRVAGASLLFLAALAFSTTNAITFAHGTRDAQTATRSADADAYQRAKQALDEAERDFAAIPAGRSAAEVQTALDLRPIPADTWRKTSGCQDVTKEASRQLCGPVFALRAELATAQHRDELAAAVTTARVALDKLPAPIEADPAASAIAAYLAPFGITVEPEAVSPWLSALAVLIVELGSALGLLVATALTARPARMPQSITAEPAKAVSASPALQIAPEVTMPPPPSAGPLATIATDVKPPGRVEEFVEAQLEPAHSGSIAVADLHRSYLAWCETSGRRPADQVTFRRVLAAVCGQIGLTVSKSGRSMAVQGVTLRAVA